MGRPREHGTATRDALLAAAAEIVGAEGAGAVTVRRVADRASTSTRAVYSLFGDKDGLIRALYQVAAGAMRARHDAVPRQPEAWREIVPLALAYRAAVLEQPHLYDLWFGRAVPEVEMDDAIDVSYGAFTRVVATVTRCVEYGTFPGRDPLAIGAQLWALVHGLASLELRGIFGAADSAERRWRDAVYATVAGYRSPPDSGDMPAGR